VSDDPKAVARRFYEILNAGDVEAFDEVCSPNLVGHAGAGVDLEQLKASVRSFLEAFPDLRSEVRHLVREGDVVSSWATYHGTHKDEFAGVPGSGREIKIAAWDLFRIEGDHIVELTQYCDLFTLMNQIGALPTATPA
jgi:steroid delta-isomerase-like uncharacterized protein